MRTKVRPITPFRRSGSTQHLAVCVPR